MAWIQKLETKELKFQLNEEYAELVHLSNMLEKKQDKIERMNDELLNRSECEQTTLKNETRKANLNIADVSDWLAFDKVKPETDRLFNITNGSFVEIAYYEDGEIMKAFRYDKYDNIILNPKQNGLKWQYIYLPT